MLLEQYFDKIFCINLSRRIDRWNESLAELERIGLPIESVERFEGFDMPNDGNGGCTKSHRELLRRIAASDWNRVLVLEDDFHAITKERLKAAGFSDHSEVMQTHCSVLEGNGNLNQRFDYISDFIPAYWDVLYLGAGYGGDPLFRVNEHVIRCGEMLTTGSYGITPEFAARWCEEVDDAMGGPHDVVHCKRPIDSLFSMLSHRYNYLVLQPRLFFQRCSKSDLTGNTTSYLMSMTDPAHEARI